MAATNTSLQHNIRAMEETASDSAELGTIEFLLLARTFPPGEHNEASHGNHVLWGPRDVCNDAEEPCTRPIAPRKPDPSQPRARALSTLTSADSLNIEVDEPQPDESYSAYKVNPSTAAKYVSYLLDSLVCIRQTYSYEDLLGI